MMNRLNIRETEIDIIKGIGIILVVMGHCGAPGTAFLYMFHVALFFLAAGYCYKNSNSLSFKSVVKFCKRRIVTLWLPYVVWNSIFVVLGNCFVKLRIYDESFTASSGAIGTNLVKLLFLRGGTQLGGALWFVATLMQVAVLYCVADFLIVRFGGRVNTIFWQGCLAAVGLILGFLCNIKGQRLWEFDKVLSCYALFYVGNILKKLNHKIEISRNWIYFTSLLISGFFIFLCMGFGRIALDENKYENPLFFLFVSLMGWILCYSAAHFLKQWEITRKVFSYLGENTMPIVILHFLCFKIVSYLGICLNRDSIDLLSKFPILYRGGFWWIAYLIVGISGPILLHLVWKHIKIRAQERRV